MCLCTPGNVTGEGLTMARRVRTQFPDGREREFNGKEAYHYHCGVARPLRIQTTLYSTV